MQGLPGSGKSTKAEEILKKDGNAVRINKDLLRTMLHFDKWSGQNEGKTQKAALTLAKMFLILGNANVIIDDTNLNEKTLQSWKDLAKECRTKIEYHRMETSVEECIDRDYIREDKVRVGKDVIIQMAISSGLYPKPYKGFVLCDLDGTLADIKHRLKYVKPRQIIMTGSGSTAIYGDDPDFKKDWKKFFEGIPNDKPRLEVIDTLMKYEVQGYEIILVSARPDDYREATGNWLKDEVFHGYNAYKTLIMRKSGDKRPDTEVKQEIFNRFFKDKYHIEAVIDDRPSVIRMWRENGLNVIDVGNGVEF